MNLQNLVDFYKIDNVDLFEDCTVPEPLDMDLVKDNIMLRCGLLTPIYAEPYIFKQIVKMWFKSHQWTFEHLANVLLAEYSPIENVYESDHWTNQRSGEDTFEHGEKHTLGGKDIDTLSGEDKDTLGGSDVYKPTEKHTLGGTDTTENTISADNSSAYQPDNKSTTTYGRTDTASGSNTTEYGKTDTMKYGKKDTLEYGKTDTASGTDTTGYGLLETYDRLRHGNIGVTTNNQLINQELEMLEDFEPYDWIARVFEEDNMLQVY